MVFRRIPSRSPDESGHYEQVNEYLRLPNPHNRPGMGVSGYEGAVGKGPIRLQPNRDPERLLLGERSGGFDSQCATSGQWGWLAQKAWSLNNRSSPVVPGGRRGGPFGGALGLPFTAHDSNRYEAKLGLSCRVEAVVRGSNVLLGTVHLVAMRIHILAGGIRIEE